MPNSDLHFAEGISGCHLRVLVLAGLPFPDPSTRKEWVRVRELRPKSARRLYTEPPTRGAVTPRIHELKQHGPAATQF